MILISIALQSSVFLLSSIRYFQPDFILLAVLWCAWRRGFTEGGILTLIFGHIAEIHSAVPRGIFLSSYMLVYLGVRYASHVFQVPDLNSYLVVTFITSILWKLFTMTILNLLASNDLIGWSHTLYLLLPGAVVQVFLGLFVYKALDRFDKSTFKQTLIDEVNEGLNEEEGF